MRSSDGGVRTTSASRSSARRSGVTSSPRTCVRGRRSGAEAAATQARAYFGLDPDPSRDDIEAIVDHYPVFRIACER